MNPASGPSRRAALAVALTAPCGAVMAAAFQDPLQTPAMATRRGALAPLAAVARSGDRLVAVGRRGLVLTSDLNGQVWQQAEVPVSCDLVALHFPTPQRGWAVGHDGVILHSADGGLRWSRQADGRSLADAMRAHYEQRLQAGHADAQTWVEQARRWQSDGPIHPLFSVWFEDERRGWVGGAFGLLFRTRDGGQHWEPAFDRLDNPKGLHLYGLTGTRTAAGAEVLMAGEQGLAAVLSPGADRWTRLKLPYEGSLFGAAAAPTAPSSAGATPGTQWLLHGMRGNAFISDDRGGSWRRLPLPTRAGLTAAALDGRGGLLLATQVGECLVSADAGASFNRLKPAAPMPYFGLASAGDRRVALVGMAGVRIEALS